MWMRNCAALLVLASAWSLAGAAPVYPEYRVTIVGPAGSTAADINQAGVVVGSYPVGATQSRGFVNRGKGVITFGAPGTWTRAAAINDRDEILGNWAPAGGALRGFIYSCGKLRDLGILAGGAIFRDINNAGYTIATGLVTDTAYGPRGLLRAPNGSYRDIGHITTDEPITEVFGLNNRNQIAGKSGPLVFPEQPYRAIIWTKGTMRDLGGFGTEPNSAQAINDRGQATGFAAVTSGGAHDRVAYLYSKGRLVSIDNRGETEPRYSEGYGINNHAHIVGSSDHLQGFVWRGKRMQSLNALVDPALGWNIQGAQAINDAGQIAATAVRAGVQYAVRLDLIRPHGLAAPALDADEAADVAAIAAPSPASVALARAEAAAQAREVVRPVAQ